MKHPPLASTPDVNTLLADNCPVAIGISGGKDSTAVAIATVEHLRRIKHRGPTMIIHSDLGRAEWKKSQAVCEEVADRLGYSLVTVKRRAGDMLDRWETRWENNTQRYANLECVKLILPWSTPSMRFCTSELKTDIICRELVKRFADYGKPILSVSGIRREESTARLKAPVVKAQPKLCRRGLTGFDWHPIIDWKLEDVWAITKARGFPIHEAYTKYGASRVSCAFCIMSAQADLRAAAGCADNNELYRAMCWLETNSTFAFQDDKWLCDVAPELLTASHRSCIPLAKQAAIERQAAEEEIPEHLLYEKGWPKVLPTRSEAQLLARVRRRVADAVGIQIAHRSPAAIEVRYRELMREKQSA